MSQLNLQVNALSFSDNNVSNNPLIRHFDLTYKLFSLSCKSPDQNTYTLAPGESKLIYDGTRTTSIDNTTAFDLIKPYPSKNIYRFLWNGSGTQPVFRTDRAIGITTSTQFQVTTNGPLATFTVTSGPFSTTNIVVGDTMLVQNGCGCTAPNCGRFTVLSKTATSVTVKNANAVNETFTIIDTTKFLIFSNGGVGNQVQIGDTVTISSGFSPVIWGSYEIIEVTPDWIEVMAGSSVGGFPLETNIVPGINGIIIYKSVKKFLLLAAQQKVSVLFNSDPQSSVFVEPIEPDNPERAGLLIKNGSFYRMSVKNETVHQCNVLIATAE